MEGRDKARLREVRGSCHRLLPLHIPWPELSHMTEFYLQGRLENTHFILSSHVLPLNISLIRKRRIALVGPAQWIEHRLANQGSQVRFPVRAHAWGAGWVPTKGCMQGNHTSMFPSLSFSLPPPLSKNK